MVVILCQGMPIDGCAQHEEFNDLTLGPASRLWCGSEIETSPNLQLLFRECAMPCPSHIQKRRRAAADPEVGVLLVECYVMPS